MKEVQTNETKYGSLTLTDESTISWFTSHAVAPDVQDEWVQEVTGRETAVLSGYSLSHDPLELEIEYRYIGGTATIKGL